MSIRLRAALLGAVILLPLQVASAQAPGNSSAASGARPAIGGGLATGEHQVVIDGVRFWYRVAGTGEAGAPPLVFLHGGPGYNSWSFEHSAGPALERGVRVVYYDQRGSGRSERPWNEEYSMERLVADVEGLRRALGVPRLALMGHSFGGSLALEYAAKYPERVSRLVLIGGASDIPAACHARVDYLAQHYAAELARARADTVGKGGAPRGDCDLAFNTVADSIRGRVNDEVMFPDLRLAHRQDSVDAEGALRNTGELSRALFDHGFLEYRFASPGRVRMPVLILAGREDYAIGLPQQRALARALPDARIVEYEHAGHFLYLDEPERFGRDVLAFLGAGDGAATSRR